MRHRWLWEGCAEDAVPAVIDKQGMAQALGSFRRIIMEITAVRNVQPIEGGQHTAGARTAPALLYILQCSGWFRRLQGPFRTALG